jgi:hypothetical protein
MNLLVFSHSDYNYLWDIIEETIQPLSELNPIFISNATSFEKPKGFTKYIEYDENDCYAKRWLNILPQINEDTILIVHDVQIIIECDINKIHKIMDCMKENNIDRCSLNVFHSPDQITIDDDIQLCNLNSPDIQSKTFIPFDQSPAIWKRQSFFELWKTFPEETYRHSELNNEIQNYCKEKLNIYGLNNNNKKIYYCLGRPYHKLFKILFITIAGEITYPIDVYMDMKDDFIRLFKKYKLEEKNIPINHNYGFILQ